MDKISAKRRSEIMSHIRGKDTTPEMIVRRTVHSWGFRYRVHVRDLPGKPDLVLRAARKVVFVNGCFWHQHPGCRMAYQPKSRIGFWQRKLTGNLERDQRNALALADLGWRVFTVWECELESGGDWMNRLRSFLEEPSLEIKEAHI